MIDYRKLAGTFVGLLVAPVFFEQDTLDGFLGTVALGACGYMWEEFLSLIPAVSSPIIGAVFSNLVDPDLYWYTFGFGMALGALSFWIVRRLTLNAIEYGRQVERQSQAIQLALHEMIRRARDDKTL